MTQSSSIVESKAIVLRRYPKIIFIFPLFFVSLTLTVIQFFSGSSNLLLDIIWIFIFFINLFIIAFETSSTRLFLIVILSIFLVFLGVYFIIPNISQ
jgi:hypothetical protein